MDSSSSAGPRQIAGMSGWKLASLAVRGCMGLQTKMAARLAIAVTVARIIGVGLGLVLFASTMRLAVTGVVEDPADVAAGLLVFANVLLWMVACLVGGSAVGAMAWLMLSREGAKLSRAEQLMMAVFNVTPERWGAHETADRTRPCRGK